VDLVEEGAVGGDGEARNGRLAVRAWDGGASWAAGLDAVAVVKSVVVWASVGSVAVGASDGAGEGAWSQVRAWLAREAGLE
jgi:hypothetical protein